jgi:hypothetical protein
MSNSYSCTFLFICMVNERSNSVCVVHIFMVHCLSHPAVPVTDQESNSCMMMLYLSELFVVLIALSCYCFFSC